ncbi:MAG: LacI family DNA-binding transcriptional regulator [Planctomycetota bacterium]
MASVRKIASVAGVSPATVSRILNNDPDVDQKTREAVLKIANNLGYSPRIGRRVKTIVGIALPSDPTRDLGSFDGALVSGASRGCRDEGFNLAIVDLLTERKPNEAYTQLFSRLGIRGIILRRLPALESILEELAVEGYPHVLIADRTDDERISWIHTDSKTPSRDAVRHLIELGHRRIMVGRYTKGGSDTVDRYEGYLAAHQEAGIEVDPRLVVDCGDELEDGARAIDFALSLPEPPTGVYMTHSMSSVGALRRIQERGLRVPEDISLVGLDDCDSRLITHPRMTAVRQDTYDMAYQAARWLVRAVESPSEPMRVVIPGLFEVNQTTSLAPDLPIRVLPDGRLMVTGQAQDEPRAQ